jgi:hypothetical protein
MEGVEGVRLDNASLGGCGLTLCEAFWGHAKTARDGSVGV